MLTSKRNGCRNYEMDHTLTVLSRFLEQSVHHLLSEQRLVYYLQIGRETLWPGGKFMTAAPPPTEEEQLALRIQAERKLVLAMPGTDITDLSDL